MPNPIVLSYVQIEPLLARKRAQESELDISPDLGMTSVTVAVSQDGIVFPSGERVSWPDIERIKKATSNCFLVEQASVRPIQVFSEATNRMCSLFPTKGVPSMLIGGFTMHRIVDIDPMEDTRRKIAALRPVTGLVLDTATGLGYTAIEAAKTAQQVVTIELDPGAQAIARMNPWSRDLFDNPRIEQMMGDSFEVVPTLEPESFSCIIHDPPVFSLAGELYSGEFYRQLHRVLKRGGRLFHYIGNLESKSSGTVARGVLRRLQEAGFSRVVRKLDAFGVVAYKQ